MKNKLSDSFKEKCKNQNIEIINVEDGSTFGGNAFIEVFFEECLIRGESKKLLDAENILSEKLIKIQNCNHEFERFNKKGRAKCKLCNFSKNDVFENLEICFKCDSKHPVIYIDRDKYCIDHAKESLEQLQKENIISSHQKNMLIFIHAIDELGLIKEAKDTNELSNMELLVSDLYHKSYTFLMDIAEEIADEEIKDHKDFNEITLSYQRFEKYYEILMSKKETIQKFILSIDNGISLNKDDFREFIS